MPIRFEFELDDDDLAHFRKIIEQKRVGQRGIAVSDLDSAVRELLAGARVAHTPGFILRMLEREGVTGHIIVVTRWYGGKHLGGDRFRHVQDAVRTYLAEAKL